MPFVLRFSQKRIRAIILGIITATAIISLTLFFLWRWVNNQVELIVGEQFNQQQLELARKIADSVEVYLDLLENELLSYEHLFEVEAGNPAHFTSYVKKHFKYLQKFGILGILHYDAAGREEVFFHDALNGADREAGVIPPLYLAWAKEPQNRGHILLTRTFTWVGPPWPGRRMMAMLTPLYSADPGGGGLQFRGVIKVLFDPFFICQKAAGDVRSGKTGYAWIIDQDGTFLAHYEPAFIGKHAIRVREERNIQLSFSRIQEIQEQKLLKGREGTDWYESGWHREKLGQMKKLLAYTPIRFDKGLIRHITMVEDPEHNLWGVGVAAPYTEVYGLIQRFQTQQGLLIGFFFLLIIGVSGAMIGVAYSWNKSLAHEVEVKTEELQESHDRLLRSERFAAVGEAAAYVSHEIKNPLMVIGGFANQLERNPQMPEPGREKLRIISSEVKRLETFLGELRDFTRPAAPTKKVTDLNGIITEVQKLMQEAARENGIALEVNLDPDLPEILLDPNQIKQVLINLVKNSLEAMDAEGQITIGTSTQNGNVCLAVADTGKGIKPEIMREIFNPFFTTKKSGTGLGLAVINKIVEDHHGTISVESTSGKGTKFSILFETGK